MAETKPTTGSEEEAVTAVMRSFSRAVGTFDADLMVSLWDPAAETIVYQPEELHHAIYSRDALHSYIRNLPHVIRGLYDTRVVDRKLEVCGEFAHAYVRFWCRIERPDDEPVDGQVRQTYLLRKRPSGWFFVQYHESRQVPGFATPPSRTET
ncbi:YybH family protein [Prauserella muralis]|uniref:Uncharacterized protein n=1 Tax=Prauserella muralis TaxID=588067 RepID=A0A2V4AG10_9PSEU|nr:nuclear transport factor 2 family protein [Prauserella muralis]PXY18888.1 hypothetical protein BAY60_29035 [Prauserella muralis]TWE28755.1 SnoaL-like protein [Prauserella muralis]